MSMPRGERKRYRVGSTRRARGSKGLWPAAARTRNSTRAPFIVDAIRPAPSFCGFTAFVSPSDAIVSGSGSVAPRSHRRKLPCDVGRARQAHAI